MNNKIAFDMRLVDIKNTGISRFSEVFFSFYTEKYGYDNIVLITNERLVQYSHIEQFVTHLKPYNISHFLCFPLFLFSNKIENLVSFHYGGLAYGKSKINCLITVHDLMYRKVPTFFGSKFKSLLGRFYYEFIVRLSVINATQVLSISRTTFDDVKECFGVDSSRISEGVFLDAEPDGNILSKIDVSEGEYFLYAGNSRPHKNIDFMINEFISSGVKEKLIIVGHSGINTENVIYPGFVSDEELVALYINAKAFIFPSLYEGFGLPVLESINYRTHVYASDISAFREFNSSNVHLFDVNRKGSLKELILSDFNFDLNDRNKVLNNHSWPKLSKQFIDHLSNQFKFLG